MVKLAEYLPDYYDEVSEIQKLTMAEQVAVDGNADQLSWLLLNQYVLTADAQGLSLFEYQLGIKAEVDTTLEARRYNILMRILPPQPITIGYFRSLVEAMQIPVTIEVDAVNSMLTTVSQESDVSSEQIDRLRYLLNVYVPVNLAYQIIKQQAVSVSEHVNVGQAVQVSVTTSVGADPVNLKEVS